MVSAPTPHRGTPAAARSGASGPRWSRLPRLLTVGLLGLGALGGLDGEALGRRKVVERAADQSPTEQQVEAAQKLLTDAKADLQKGVAKDAYQKLEKAYQLAPGPEALYGLAQVALLEKRVLAAQDLMRRYLSDPELEIAPDSPEQKEAARILALPRPPSAQLSILGDRGSLVSVDGLLVGALPLTRPLLLATGDHKVEIIRDGQRVVDDVRVPVGRLGELRVQLSAKALVLTILPGVLVLEQYTGLLPAEQAQIEQALELAVQSERLSPFRRVALVAQEKDKDKAPSCSEGPEKDEPLVAQPAVAPDDPQLSCQVALARSGEADYVLRARIAKDAAGWKVALALVDVEVGAVAAVSEQTCGGCNVERTSTFLRGLFGPLYKAAAARGHGKLEISSQPNGAEVRIDGTLIGTTPIRKPSFAGTFALSFALRDYEKATESVQVPDGGVGKLEVPLRLLPEPTPVPLKRYQTVVKQPQRPLWRVLAGSALAAGGLITLGFGAKALSLNGQLITGDVGEAPPAGQSWYYETGTIGTSLVGIGAAALIGGVVLGALPARKQRVEVPVSD